MDVGNPSNFIRIQEIYGNDFHNLKQHLSSFSYSDAMTQDAMRELYEDFNYVADPHGAIGYLGAKDYLKLNPNTHCVFLETAHPTKFLNVVEDVIQKKLELPEQIKSVIHKKKSSINICQYSELKSFLLNNL